jgi:hypothetical protein
MFLKNRLAAVIPSGLRQAGEARNLSVHLAKIKRDSSSLRSSE